MRLKISTTEDKAAEDEENAHKKITVSECTVYAATILNIPLAEMSLIILKTIMRRVKPKQEMMNKHTEGSYATNAIKVEYLVRGFLHSG